MSDLNYYQVLSITRAASRDEIRKAYVRQVKRSHPDLTKPNGRPGFRLEDLQCAYRCLLDPEARRLHDALLEQSDLRHMQRLRRVERRLWHRSRSNSSRFGDRYRRERRVRRIDWRLLLLLIGSVIIVVKAHEQFAIV